EPIPVSARRANTPMTSRFMVCFVLCAGVRLAQIFRARAVKRNVAIRCMQFCSVSGCIGLDGSDLAIGAKIDKARCWGSNPVICDFPVFPLALHREAAAGA